MGIQHSLVQKAAGWFMLPEPKQDFFVMVVGVYSIRRGKITVSFKSCKVHLEAFDIPESEVPFTPKMVFY